MQVLGGLIHMHEELRLPVPWWHRAPLGLLNGTEVYVALTETAVRPVGDLIVSVLNLEDWDDMLQIQCERSDAPGVLAEVFKTVVPLNVALAETVTVDAGRAHHVTIICERHADKEPREHVREIEEKLRAAKFEHPAGGDLKPVFNKPIALRWSDDASISYGWVEKVRWRDEIRRHYGEEACRQVDLNRAVLSADTEQRLLRYIFPRIGAQTIRVEHRDEPGALEHLLTAIMKCEMNVLSALLRRGGTRRNRAELVAVCEPQDETVDINLMQGRVSEEITRIPRHYKAKYKSEPDSEAVDTIYPRRPYTVVAQVPTHLINTLDDYDRSYGRQFGDNKPRVFFSRRFIPGHERAQVEKHIRQVLEQQHGCVIVEARPAAQEATATPQQVQAKMWLSEAAIVLVAKEKDSDDGFSANLAHEYGFFQGQGKPVLFLVQKRCLEEFQRKLSNHTGLYVAHFPDDDGATNPNRVDSVDRLIAEWMRTWRSR